MCLKLSGQASQGFGEGLPWLQVLTKTLVWVLSSLLSPRSLSFPTFLLTSCTFPAPTPALFFQSPSSSLNLASASPCCTLLPPGPRGADPAYLPRLFLRVDKGRPSCHSEFLSSSKAGTLPCTRKSWGADALANADSFSGKFLKGGGELIMQTTPNSISCFMLSLEPVMEAPPDNSDLPITYSLSRGNKEKQLPWCDIRPSLQSHLHLRLRQQQK